MIQVNGKILRKLQMIQLEMLLEVDRICRKCNIKYNIMAGGAFHILSYRLWEGVRTKTWTG